LAIYEVGFLLGRCHLQKRITLSDGSEAIPLGPTGFAGEIHDVRVLLAKVDFKFTRKVLENTLANFREAGHVVLLKLPAIDAGSFSSAIDLSNDRATGAMGALAIVSANPVTELCAWARTDGGDAGVKFFIPADRKIRHATNIAGFLDAASAIEDRARTDNKYAGLLRLYRASLREREIDHQLLFQLILFEEASDEEQGNFAERLRSFAERYGFVADLTAVALECGLPLPDGKDMIDVLVKLRNAAAHNGRIDASSLGQFNGAWAVPLLDDKPSLHRAVGEAIRYMFCALVGHTRDAKATRVTGSIEIRFD
jgi:hypothetical protein